MSKPVILTFVKYYLPGFKAGGPLRSISNLVERLGEDFEFRIVTLDRDSGDEQPYANVTAGIWTKVGRAKVMYLDRRSITISRLLEILSDSGSNVIYFNSFFDTLFTAKPAFVYQFLTNSNRPIVIAPRGEFSCGAVSMKAWKKRPFISLMRGSGLFKNACWQASSIHEAEDIRREFGRSVRIVVAPNLSADVGRAGPTRAGMSGGDSGLRIVFVSRISPKKNLDFALRVLSRVREQVVFTIVGPHSDRDYHSRCVALSRSLPDNVEVVWAGGVDNAEVKSLIARHDLFFLPTRGENYGHVIAEALATGTPVLLADTTPWRGLEAQGVGWDLPLEREDPFVTVIEAVAKESAAERNVRRSRVVEFARQRLEDPGILRANQELFTCMLER